MDIHIEIIDVMWYNEQSDKSEVAELINLPLEEKQ